MSARLFLVSAAMVAAAGCASRSLTGSASVEGTIAGRSFPAVEAVSWPGAGGVTTIIDISTFDGACKAVATKHVGPGSQLLGLDIMNYDSPKSANNLLVGTYLVGATTELAAGGIYLAENANCVASSGQIQSGSVQITSVASDAIGGAFDVTLTSGDRVTGNFNATPCPAFVPPDPTGPLCP